MQKMAANPNFGYGGSERAHCQSEIWTHCYAANTQNTEPDDITQENMSSAYSLRERILERLFEESLRTNREAFALRGSGQPKGQRLSLRHY
ncbi:hypothetical protein MRB53_014087 [Persea americana]|uniref:Uncharacterized protein n=1 Tax=Persea americana TaxID=3435 RepID=A0ACC2KA71_PERAE|nr:hypothetical protein MRB53_014087 [Persea americana]